MTSPAIATLEDQIDLWRTFVRRRQAIHAVDIVELEDHLREQVAGLGDAGLSSDEAFLVAVKRMGALDALSREFAREHSDRLWKQLVVPLEPADDAPPARRDAVMAFGLAIAAALSVKLPALFGMTMMDHETAYVRNAPLFAFPFVTAYFAWKRQLSSTMRVALALTFVLAAVLANIHPLPADSALLPLGVIHLPIALWLVVGVAYAGTRWREVAGRMDFIRYSGELFIYYVLIALGGGVFTAFLINLFQAIGVSAESFAQQWIIPCGAAAAVTVASWLVESKQSVIENMAPVLTRLFTPLFTILLLTFLGGMLVTGRGVHLERDMLLAFDLLLVMVLALLLYSASARDPRAPSGVFDVMQVVLVVSALVADLVALSAIVARLSEYGASPNRVAVLGINLILLVNLAVSAFVYTRFVRGAGTFSALERWQTRYLPVYALWAVVVVVVFPLLFSAAS